jgi:regulator of extracellular matrix RemA (YlzA/DUF370 family)
MMINIGYKNYISKKMIVTMLSAKPDGKLTLPVAKTVRKARESGRLIDCTHGRRTKTVIVVETGHIILSTYDSKTLANKIKEKEWDMGNIA